jgi:hypothetical protein
MKATHTYRHSTNKTSAFKGQRGFFSMALGLGIAALMGATSAMIVSTKDDGGQTAAISQQPLDEQGIKLASTTHCLPGEQGGRQSGQDCS